MKKKIIALFSLSVLSSQSFSAVTLYDTEGMNVDIKGKMSLRADVVDLSIRDEGNMSNNGSEVGFIFKKSLSEDSAISAHFDWAVNIFAGDNVETYSVNDNRLGTESNASDVLANKRGYLQYQHDKFGRVNVGKINSVYLGVAKQTDQFELNGGEASAAYGISDGSATALGRPSQAVQYLAEIESGHHHLKGGVQAQVLRKEVSVIDKAIDDGTYVMRGSYGVAAEYLFDNIYSVSTSYMYNNTSITVDSKKQDKPYAYSLAFAYNLENDGLQASLLGAVGRNVRTDVVNPYDKQAREGIAAKYPEALGSLVKHRGIEAYVGYQINHIKPYIGYNYAEPQNSKESSFVVKKATVGVQYTMPQYDKLTFALEGLFDRSHSASAYLSKEDVRMSAYALVATYKF